MSKFQFSYLGIDFLRTFRIRETGVIVFTQMTKTDLLTLRAEADHIPDLHRLILDHHAIDQ